VRVFFAYAINSSPSYFLLTGSRGESWTSHYLLVSEHAKFIPFTIPSTAKEHATSNIGFNAICVLTN
jgi:hypothetical protein